MHRPLPSAWTLCTVAASLIAVCAVTVWPPSQSLRDEVACERARASSPTQALVCDVPRDLSWGLLPVEETTGGGLAGTDAESRYALGPAEAAAHEPEGPGCHSSNDGCRCTVPVESGEFYSVANHTDWFGGGPDSPGRLGVSVSNSWNDGPYWWQERSASRPTSIVVAEDTLCVTFEEDSYALDPDTLLPTGIDVPTGCAFVRRMRSGHGILIMLLVLLSIPVILIDHRRYTLQKLFGADGGLGDGALFGSSGGIVRDAVRLQTKHIRWHGRKPGGECEVLVVCGREVASGPAYRNDHLVYSDIQVFPGRSAQFIKRTRTLIRRTMQWGRLVSCGQLALLTVLFLCLWAGW